MKEKVTDISKTLSPLLAAALVAVCVLISLSGYEEPTYAEESGDASADATESGDAADEELLETVQGAFDLEDGVYVGSANGYSGTITVSVEIQDRTIVAITIVSESDDDVYFNAATAVIDTIIATQSLDVDAITGATYSSNGIIKAIRNALYGEEDTEEVGSVTASTAVSGSSTTVSTVDESDAEYVDGTYYGSGTGFSGTITVKVVISGGKISSITITDSSDDASYLNSAKAVISAIISAQSTNVDTVSGATYSSVGIIKAVRSALSKAKAGSSSDDDASDDTDDADDADDTDDTVYSSSEVITGTVPYDDGIYYGTGDGYGGDIVVAVVIQNETIAAILVQDASGEDTTFLNRAMSVITAMLSAQSTDVDTVSGATCSSVGLIEAVQDALADAARVTNGEEAQNSPYTSSSSSTSSSESSSDNDFDDTDDADDEVDTSALEKLISMAESLSEENYTEDSWAALQEVLSEAQALLELLSGDTQTQADEMADALSEAITGLEEAENAEVVTTYASGTYEETVTVYADENWDFDDYNMTVSVTILNDVITAISYVTDDGSEGNTTYISRAFNGTGKKTGMVEKILAIGTLEALEAYESDDIDAVSGATCTSNAIVEACVRAFAQALAAKG